MVVFIRVFTFIPGWAIRFIGFSPLIPRRVVALGSVCVFFYTIVHIAETQTTLKVYGHWMSLLEVRNGGGVYIMKQIVKLRHEEIKFLVTGKASTW